MSTVIRVDGRAAGTVLVSRLVVDVTDPSRKRGRMDHALIPTPLLREGERPPVQIVDDPLKGRPSLLGLLLQILRLTAWLAWRRVRRRSNPAEAAERVRGAFEDLGGLWIKAGQLLSLRNDILSKEMADQLGQLAFSAHGFDPEISRRSIEQAIRAPIAEVFSEYDELPFAAASISQVHRARLAGTGEVVAIKVQRPGIEKVFRRDLKTIKLLVSLVRRLPQVDHIKWDGMLRELGQIMEEEVDYRYEIANLRRTRRLLKAHNVIIPRVHRKLCSRDVIVMEFIPGVLMSDYVRLRETDPVRVRRWCAANNVEPMKVGSRLMRSFYRQLFEDDLFHGDLHPGNILLLRDSRFALIDLGAVGTMEKKLLEFYRLTAQSFTDGNYDKSIDYFLLQADSVPALDYPAFKADAVELYRKWEARTHLHDTTFLEKSVTGGLANDLSSLARKHKINPSWQLLRVGRTLATLDANLSVLLEGSNPNRILKRYFRDYRRREIRRLRKGLGRNVVGALTEARMAASFATDTLRQGAIRVSKLQSKAEFLTARLIGLLRVGALVGLVVLAYDFLHHHHGGFLLKWGPLERIATAIPAYEYGLGLVLLLAGILLVRQLGAVRKRYEEPDPQGPVGVRAGR